MKKLILSVAVTITLMLFIKCSTPLEKPFVIVQKEDYCGGKILYTYIDKNNNQVRFVDTDKYNIGHTIK